MDEMMRQARARTVLAPQSIKMSVPGWEGGSRQARSRRQTLQLHALIAARFTKRCVAKCNERWEGVRGVGSATRDERRETTAQKDARQDEYAFWRARR